MNKLNRSARGVLKRRKILATKRSGFFEKTFNNFMPFFPCQLQGDAHGCYDNCLSYLLLLSSENKNAIINVVPLPTAAVVR